MKRKPERCRHCKYRSEDAFSYSCDYVWFTGKSRMSQLQSPEQLKPENCPFFEKGRRAVNPKNSRGGHNSRKEKDNNG